MAKPFDFSDFEMTGASGMDAHFQRESTVATKPTRQKVGSLGDIAEFIRTSGEQLIHKSTRDLWSLKKEADGNYFIERLFDDNGEPLKG